jgi:mannose-6-phosphate isomerase-like protein (cupin superfamily)
MSYAPSPRPNFDVPTHIPYRNVTRHLWGEPASGNVSDWIYVSSEQIHQLVFGLPPGASFRHSNEFRTIFAADEVLTVLSGTLAIMNPENGEVQIVEKDSSVFFRRDTWHHAMNYSTESLRVLELFAPPPSQGTSGSYAKTKNNLDHSTYVNDDLLGHWPEAERSRECSFSVRHPSDCLWRLEGPDQVLVGVIASTEHLTVGRARLLAGQNSGPRRHAGDTSMYALAGTLFVHVPDAPAQKWFELEPRDGFYVPQGYNYEWWSMGDEGAELLFGVAPEYRRNSAGVPDDASERK